MKIRKIQNQDPFLIAKEKRLFFFKKKGEKIFFIQNEKNLNNILDEFIVNFEEKKTPLKKSRFYEDLFQFSVLLGILFLVILIFFRI